MPMLTLTDLDEVQALYNRGLYLQAYEASRPLGELKDWRGAHGRVLAGRLAGKLGSSRLANALYWLAWREQPGDSAVALFRAYTQLSQFGPYNTLRWVERLGELGFDDTQRAEWMALQARCCAQLRDADQADALIAQARSLAPERRWIDVEHASVLEQSDRYAQGLEVILGCLDRHPDYDPALHSAAHLLSLTGERGRAIELLSAASQRLENGALHCQLAAMLREEHRIEETREQYELGVAKMPLMDPAAGGAWLSRVRSDLASRLGDPDTALQLLQEVPGRHKGYFYKQVEGALRDRPADAARKLLDVGFIRQHFRTCAPATLAMLAAYWDRPAEHLEIADAICFDGTPYHAERQWAEDAGYVVAEFTVDPASTVALIDRGVPFTFSTNEPDSAHLQAVIGYDTTRRVLLLRDPFYPAVGEMLMDSLDERYGGYGPRGMVMIPPDKSHLLDGLELTDRVLWEHTHRLRTALIDHDRPGAVRALDAMREQAPDATPTLNAELSLANYDNSGDARSRLIERLVERYPKCPALVPGRLASLSERGLRQERLDLLREASEREDASAALILRYARELAEDAREHGRAAWHYRRLIRRNEHNAEAYHGLGSLLWKHDQREQATELYRVSACIENLREHYALTLFRAKRFFRQEQEVLTFLGERFERLGDKGAGPARTLYEAHRMMSRADLGFTVLERAIQRRPEDGALMLFAAEELSSYGQRDRAAALLDQARPHSSTLDWRRAAAALAYDAGRMAEAREHWHTILAQSPLDLQAQRAWCSLTNRLEGQDKTLAHMRQAVDRFPHHWDLQYDLYHELVDANLDEAINVLQRLIDQLPNDAWALREMGFRCAEVPGGLERARAAAQRAHALAPNDVSTYNLLGRIAEMTGDTDGARDAYRQAIRCDADASYPIERLIEQYDDRAERRAATRFILEQLAEQVTFGEGILSYAGIANRVLDPDEVLGDLRQARDARPDLWQSWATLIDQLLLCNQLPEAAAQAEQATDRFPLTPNLWFRRAEVHRVRLEHDGRVRCLVEALRMAPGYMAAVAELADAHEEHGDTPAAERVLREALDRAPRSARYHTRLADLLWRAGRADEALDHIEQAVGVEPDVTACWDRFVFWSEQAGQPEAPAKLARELTTTRPAEAGVWLNLADVLRAPRDLDERLAALDRCLELQPRNTDAYDLKAQVLVQAHRYDEARAACDPPAFNGRPPFNLAGRACWVDYQRGKTDEAIKSLWQIVEDEPTYLWALKLLTDWCGEAKDLTGQVRATDLLVQADPNDHVALGYRADARMQQAGAPGVKPAERKRLRRLAKSDFDRAVRLSPGYNFATDQLFNMHLDDGELDAADALLAHAGDYLRPESRQTMLVALACKRGQKQDAEALLRELCVMPTDQNWVYSYAYDHAKTLKLARPVFEQMCKDPRANPLIAEQLAYAVTRDTGSWKQTIKAVNKLRHWPEGWDHAAGYLLNDLGERGVQEHHRSMVAAFYRANRQRIIGSEHAWKGAIFALAGMDLCAQTIELFAGWEQRNDIEPWMLCNLANAYLTLGQLDRAEAIVRAALDMPPDHSYPRHLIDYGQLLALRGQAQQARQLLEQVIVDQLPGFYQFTYYLGQAVIAAHLAESPAQRRQQSDQLLRTAASKHTQYKKDLGSRKAYRRAVQVIGRLGRPWDRFRGWLRAATT